MGDANASIPTVQPTYPRRMWGSNPSSAALNSIAFVSQLSITSSTISSYNLSKRILPVKNTRSIGKKDMKWNDSTPVVSVDPEGYVVRADGEEVSCGSPVERTVLAGGYNWF